MISGYAKPENGLVSHFLQDFPGVNHSISFSFAILCVYISLFNLQIPSLVYINVHEYYLTPSSFLYTCSQFATFTFINIYVKILQAEIQVHAVCPNVVLVNLILQTDMYIFFRLCLQAIL